MDTVVLEHGETQAVQLLVMKEKFQLNANAKDNIIQPDTAVKTYTKQNNVLFHAQKTSNAMIGVLVLMENKQEHALTYKNAVTQTTQKHNHAETAQTMTLNLVYLEQKTVQDNKPAQTIYGETAQTFILQTTALIASQHGFAQHGTHVRITVRLEPVQTQHVEIKIELKHKHAEDAQQEQHNPALHTKDAQEHKSAATQYGVPAQTFQMTDALQLQDQHQKKTLQYQLNQAHHKTMRFSP